MILVCSYSQSSVPYFLYKGTTSANFIMFGNSPVVIDLLKTSTSTWARGFIISFSKILLILSCPLLALAGRAVTIRFNSSSQVGVRKRLALFDCRSFKYDVILLVSLGIFSAKHLPTPAKYLANLLLIFLAPYSLILSILRYSIRLLLLWCLPAISLIIFQSFFVWVWYS